MNVALLAPAGTVTTAALTSSSASASDVWPMITSSPPEGAGALIVTVAVEGLPPTTRVGLSVTAETTGPVAGAVKFSLASSTRPPNSPETLTAVSAVTALLVTGKIAVMLSAGTVTLTGMLTALESLKSDTTAPLTDAAALNRTIPVAPAPPTRLGGFTTTEVRNGPVAPGVTFSAALCVVPRVPEIVAVASADTALVFTVNERLVAPAGTVTLAGTATAGELSDSSTTKPPAGTMEFKFTNPSAALPPITLLGFTVTVESEGAVPVG